jgi:hypothetical protein
MGKFTVEKEKLIQLMHDVMNVKFREFRSQPIDISPNTLLNPFLETDIKVTVGRKMKL